MRNSDNAPSFLWTIDWYVESEALHTVIFGGIFVAKKGTTYDIVDNWLTVSAVKSGVLLYSAVLSS